MCEKAIGDYFIFDVDWEKDEMTLREASTTLQFITRESIPITPMARAARELKRRRGGDGPVRFILELQYDDTSILASLHPTEDFQSVINVARPRVARLLGDLLSPRELEVAVELFEGRTIRYIAGHLHIAEGTVKRMIYNVYQKLNVGSQVDLIREIYTRLAQHAAMG